MPGQRGETMTGKLTAASRGALIAAVFSFGYLLGTAQSPAQAQLDDIGKQMGSGLLEKAADSEGMLGQATRLGATIVEMEEHVNGLQKNIDTLNTIKAALGG
jgi:hypothetical protein